MKPICLHDRDLIAAMLSQNPALHLYTLGDLDDFFWPYTTWYAFDGQAAGPPILLYSGTALPTLLALSDDAASMTTLLEAVAALLPRRMYAHLSAGLLDALPDYAAHHYGEHVKMLLRHPEKLAAIDRSEVVRLGMADLAELLAFYAASYPDNWFDPRMLETGFYYGLRQQGQLVSAAGVHVYSPRYRVAALGNVTTLPAWRGRGLASAVCAQLCRDLAASVDTIGLNVGSHNQAALAAYQRLGFEPAATYDEYMLEWRASGAGVGR